MLRHLTALILCAGAVGALETPLTLIDPQSRRVVVIDPSFGSISLYEASQSRTDRVSGLRQPQANFIAEIESRLKSFIDEQNGLPIQTLRLGQETRPSYADMFAKVLPQKPTVREANAGKKALCWRVRDSEDAFWKGEPAYDGVVRAAISSSGQYLLLGVPSLHMLLLYQVDGEAIRLAGLRNYGPELFMTGMNTSPNPGQLLQEVLRRIPKERESEARAALGIEDEASPVAFTPPALAAEATPTPRSDLWIGPGNRDTFLVVDTLNSCAMLYQAQGLILTAQRDLRVDLAVPSLVGGSLSSSPASEVLIKDFMNQRKEYIVKYGLPTEREEILLLIGQRKPQGSPITFEALSDANSGLAMINFVDRRVFLTLEHLGGTALNLAAARDYTLDIAITLLDQEIQDRERAKALLASLPKLASTTKLKAALLTLRQTLSLDPTLHKEAEAKLKNAFKNNADLQAQFTTMLDEAAKKAEVLAKQAEDRKKTLMEKNRKPK